MKLLKGILSSVLISENVNLCRNDSIGTNSTIHNNAVMNDDSVISAHCILGEPLAEAMADEVLSLPMGPHMDSDVVQAACRATSMAVE